MSMGNWVQCGKTKAAAVVLSHAMYGICFLLDGLMGYAYAPLLPISVLFEMLPRSTQACGMSIFITMRNFL